MIRTGAQFQERLAKTPREVWLRGERVDDVTTHPAFIRPVQHLARLYDMQHEDAYRSILTRPGARGSVGAAFVAPRTYDDLVGRREAFLILS